MRPADTVLIAVIVIVTALAILTLNGCAGQPSQPVEIEAPAPDFYDRTGNACWRMNDLVWCDDGYGSWEDNNEEPANDQTP